MLLKTEDCIPWSMCLFYFISLSSITLHLFLLPPTASSITHNLYLLLFFLPTAYPITHPTSYCFPSLLPFPFPTPTSTTYYSPSQPHIPLPTPPLSVSPPNCLFHFPQPLTILPHYHFSSTEQDSGAFSGFAQRSFWSLWRSLRRKQLWKNRHPR